MSGAAVGQSGAVGESKVDLRAVAAHGIGRGDFAALVFSGSIAALGEVPGYCTWNTARKFALPDPRVPEDLDLLRGPGSVFAPWHNGSTRPTDGVCFVFADEAHPAVDAIKARGGVHLEHYVVLERLTLDSLLAARLAKFIALAGSRPIAILGFGDQGTRAAAILEDLVPSARLHVLDDRPERQVALGNRGLAVIRADSPVLQEAAIFSAPLARPAAFDAIVRQAIDDGRTVLDNALPWDDRAEIRPVRGVWMTSCAERVLRVRGRAIRPQDHGLDLPLVVIRDHDAVIGTHRVRMLDSRQRVRLGLGAGCAAELDLGLPDAGSPATALEATFCRAFVNIDGQSNHHDAAFAIFSAREFLMQVFPDATAAVLPATHRSAFGVTAFERLVPRTCTGRSLGSPYMTACEQTAMGVLAREGCGAGAGGSPIVEIGSALGGSALLMAAATQGAGHSDGPTIWSIDPDAPTRGAMRALFESEGSLSRLKQVVQSSDEAAQSFGDLRGRAGMVFIDGLHTAAQSARDFANYAPLVRSGGIIAFHDCDLRHSGVYRTAATLAAADERFEFVCMVDTIAVFQRRA